MFWGLAWGGFSSTLPTCEQAEGAARPLVHVHVVGVDVAHQDAVVVVVQVVAPQHVELPPHRRHHVVDSPLQHGTAGQPLVLQEPRLWGLGGQMEGEESDADERKVRCMRREGGRQEQRGRIRRLIYKHIHAWVIDARAVLDK